MAKLPEVFAVNFYLHILQTTIRLNSASSIGQPQGVSEVPAKGALSGDAIGDQVGWFDLQCQDPIVGDMETLLPRRFDATTTTTMKQVQNFRRSEWYTICTSLILLTRSCLL